MILSAQVKEKLGSWILRSSYTEIMFANPEQEVLRYNETVSNMLRTTAIFTPHSLHLKIKFFR